MSLLNSNSAQTARETTYWSFLVERSEQHHVAWHALNGHDQEVAELSILELFLHFSLPHELNPISIFLRIDSIENLHCTRVVGCVFNVRQKQIRVIQEHISDSTLLILRKKKIELENTHKKREVYPARQALLKQWKKLRV
jgi:hypothetical protein